MDMNPEILKQLHQTFSVELEEQAQVIIDSLILIEGKKLSKDELKTTIDAMFRAAHTIKGASNSISFTDIAQIAHSLESIFSKIKNNVMDIYPGLIDSCLQAIDAMKALMASSVNGTKNDIDIIKIINQLDKHNPSDVIVSTPVQQKERAPERRMGITAAQASQDSLRVDIKQLDKLSALLDEMSLSQLAVNEYSKNFNHVVTINNQLIQSWKQLMQEMNVKLDGELSTALDKISQTTQDLLTTQAILIESHSKQLRNRAHEMGIHDSLLQDEFRLLRLVPASVLFCTMPRQVRDLGRELNKSVDITIKGDDVRVDRMILDAIKDPVIHILRNAIDHGLEDASDRVRHGKNQSGKIEVDIVDKGSQIVIKISDDGAGINLDAIKQIAIAKKVLSPESVDSMSENELIDLLFIPGFSTKSTVTSTSGRGVGLDVVRSNLEKIKGTVEISSVLGKGTAFILTLPLTLSSEHGVLVKSGDQLFAIPTVSVERILRITKSELIDVAGHQAVIVDDHTYPVFLLAALLELVSADISDNEYISTVILKHNQSAILLLVDEVIGEREIVIKQLQPPFTNIHCVSGGTLADGNQVVIVLNPHELIQKGLQKPSSARIAFSDVKTQVQERPNILVVDDSITTRTLEKNILESKNFNVSVAVNGKEAWDYIQKKSFSLVITDINMPVMDGFQLTEKIKQHDKFKSIPVIIVTSLDSDDEKRRGLEAGANAYIVKNEFESGALIEIVTQLV